MKKRIVGIVREGSTAWERRVPLVPKEVSHLVNFRNIIVKI